VYVPNEIQTIDELYNDDMFSKEENEKPQLES